MENYNLSTITRDNLYFLLCTAKDELVRYINCEKELEKCKRLITKEKNQENDYDAALLGNQILFWISIVILIGAVCYYGILGYRIGENLIALLLVIFALFYVIGAHSQKSIDKRAKKAAQNSLKKYESQLPALKEEKEKAKNDCKAIFFIPGKYLNEYALTTMIEYIEDKRASNWERVTDLYENHLIGLEMIELSREQIELSREQTELAKQTRNRAGWAAAGAWAAAVGVWRR